MDAWRPGDAPVFPEILLGRGRVRLANCQRSPFLAADPPHEIAHEWRLGGAACPRMTPSTQRAVRPTTLCMGKETLVVDCPHCGVTIESALVLSDRRSSSCVWIRCSSSVRSVAGRRVTTRPTTDTGYPNRRSVGSGSRRSTAGRTPTGPPRSVSGIADAPACRLCGCRTVEPSPAAARARCGAGTGNTRGRVRRRAQRDRRRRPGCRSSRILASPVDPWPFSQTFLPRDPEADVTRCHDVHWV
jgi:hypothetical protein